MSCSTYIIFLLCAYAVLAVIGANDSTVRAWEDEQIEKFRSVVDKTSKKN